jgi:hypothetical protein
MRWSLSLLLCALVITWCAACGSSSPAQQGSGVTVQIANAFSVVETGGAAITLTAEVSGDTEKRGVSWTLSLAGNACSPGCGTLKPANSPSLTAVYNPPATLPLNQAATIMVRSLADSQQLFVFNFQILPPISISINPKFQSVNVAGPVQDLTATISNDGTHAGVTWTLTAGGTDCQSVAQGCGTLTVDPAPSLTAHYQPPAVPPSAANASPTITAISAADSTKKDSFNFNIVTPTLSVTILNKFTNVLVGGGQPITLNASVTNDFLQEGVTWTITAGGAPCTTCGTLTAIGSPSTSATYTPPATAQVSSATITATSVFDATKSDSFTFAFITPASLVNGQYAFLLRGYDNPALQPMALAGSVTADGLGNITGGEYDVNDNATVTSVTQVSGTYTVDIPSSQILRVTFTLTGGGTTRVLKCALSADGKRGKVIELDGSMLWNAGTLLAQDPSAVSGFGSATTSFAFGLDSDAPVNLRVVEAGQFTLGPGATPGTIQLSGGIADEGQAGIGPVFGGLAGPAAIATASSSAMPPDASGRGTLTLSIAGGTNQYAYYVVNSSQLNLIEIDTGTGIKKTVQAGTARNQSALSANSDQSTSVAALTGLASGGSTPLPNVTIGVLSYPLGPNSPFVTFDNNNAGTVTHVPSTTGSFGTAYDPNTGRAIINGTFFPDAAVYYYNAGAAFVADVTTAADGGNQGLSGTLIPQSVPAGGFSVAGLSGNVIGVAGGSSNPFATNLDIAGTFDGKGNLSIEVDYTVPTNQIPPQGTNITLPGQVACQCTYNITDGNLGAGVIELISSLFGDFPNNQDQAGFYLIAPNQFVAIDTSGRLSDIMFFESQTQPPNN